MAESNEILIENSPPVFSLSDSEPEDFCVKNAFEHISSKKRIRRKKTDDSPSKKAKIENVYDCSICLSKIKAKRMGNPSGCKHNFCVDCIKKWAKKNSTCPLDRQMFGWINILDLASGNLVERIDKDGEKLDKITYPSCFLCNSLENPKLMISCDGCDEKFHVGCLPNPDNVTVSLWFCEACQGFSPRKLQNICKNNAESRGLALQRYRIHLHALSMNRNRASNSRPVVKPEAQPVVDLVEHQPEVNQPQDLLLEIMRSQESLFYARTSRQSSQNNHITKASVQPSNTERDVRLALVERLAKNVLKPFYLNKSVTKEKAKQILKIVVPKICKETNSSTDQELLNQLVQEKVLVWLDIL